MNSTHNYIYTFTRTLSLFSHPPPPPPTLFVCLSVCLSTDGDREEGGPEETPGLQHPEGQLGLLATLSLSLPSPSSQPPSPPLPPLSLSTDGDSEEGGLQACSTLMKDSSACWLPSLSLPSPSSQTSLPPPPSPTLSLSLSTDGDKEEGGPKETPGL